MPFESFWHYYWRRKNNGQRAQYIYELRRKIGKTLDEKETSGGLPTEITAQSTGAGEQRRHTEMSEYASWADVKNVYDQMHRIAYSIGPGAMRGLIR